MSWQFAAWLMLGGSTLLLLAGLPVAFTFIAVNIAGALGAAFVVLVGMLLQRREKARVDHTPTSEPQSASR